MALETYIGKLQNVASVLTDKNRRLRKWHRTITEKVTALFAMDLVRQKEAWKRAVKELRLIFANLEAEFRKDLRARGGFIGTISCIRLWSISTIADWKR